jgi:two-component system response regulator BaeR
MLTARIEEIDRLLGLELGADDYICKPFSPREVVARVRTVLRRSQPPQAVSAPARSAGKLLRAGPLSLDRERFEAQVRQQQLVLTPKEFLLLDALAVHPGVVLTRSQLLQQVYADDRDVSDRVIDSHMKNLRRKINQHLPEQELIQAVYGIGYKLVL